MLGNFIDNILLVNSLPGMLVNSIFQNVYINTLIPSWLLDLDKQQVVDINTSSLMDLLDLRGDGEDTSS